MNGRVAKRLRREAYKLAFADSKLRRDGYVPTTFRYPPGSARWIYQKSKREHNRKGRETR